MDEDIVHALGNKWINMNKVSVGESADGLFFIIQNKNFLKRFYLVLRDFISHLFFEN